MKSRHPNGRDGVDSQHTRARYRGNSECVDVDPPSDTTGYKGEAGEPVGVTDGGQPMVAEPDDGPLNWSDYKKDEEFYTESTPYSFAETTFYARAADDVKKYNALWRHHHEWDNDTTSRRTHKDKLRVAESLAGALGLSKIQKNRVRGIVAHLDGRGFNRYGGIEALALGAIAYINEDDVCKDSFLTPEERLRGRVLESKEFSEICDQQDVDGSAAYKRIKMIYRKMDAAGNKDKSKSQS